MMGPECLQADGQTRSLVPFERRNGSSNEPNTDETK